MKTNKPASIALIILVAFFSGYIFYNNIWPVVLIFKNGVPSEKTNAEPVGVPLKELILELNNWERENFGDFSLQVPEFEEVETNSEDVKSLKITDPNSGGNLILNISSEKTEIETLEEVEPNSDQAGYTLLGPYDALRIGPSEAPYSNVTYYILENNFLYKLEVEFSSPVSFLDQILSSFKIEEK